MEVPRHGPHRPLTPTTPSNQQRGVYSDALAAGGLSTSTAASTEPSAPIHATLDGRHRVLNAQYTPAGARVTSFKVPPGHSDPVSNAVERPLSAPRRAYEPKVQVTYVVPEGHVPRKIEVERRKRQFAALDLETLLSALGGLTTADLLPAGPFHASVTQKLTRRSGILPLDYFDDTEYDVRTQAEWAQLGLEDGVTCGVPAKALACVNANPSTYAWCECKVTAYDEQRALYTVVFRSPEQVVQSSGSNQYPRLLVLFKSEDPRVFAERLEAAHRLRAETEAILKYNLTVDCMPGSQDSIITDLHNAVVENILAAVGKVGQAATTHRQQLLEEVHRTYTRACNKMLLDRVIVEASGAEDPALKALTVPHAASAWASPSLLDASGSAQHLAAPVTGASAHSTAAARQQVQTLSFAMDQAVVNALSKVHLECDKVTAMSLFNVNLVKCMDLDDFQLIQAQTYDHAASYLRNVWTPNSRNMVTHSLKNQGKGWFNLKESDQHAYDNGKLRKFFCLVRLVMQDALRSLVTSSTTSLVLLIERANAAMLLQAGATATTDMKTANGATAEAAVGMMPGTTAAKGAASSQQEVVISWGREALWSDHHAPKEGSPLFHMTLTADMEKRCFTYSTPPETFEQLLLKVFDDGISATNGLPDMEPIIMSHLFWVGQPTLQSVNLQEPWVISLRERLRRSVRTSLSPLRDYARQYERYRALLDLDIKAYLAAFVEEERDPSEVKKECERHIEARRQIEADIPNSVDIGMFHVACDRVRAQLSGKCQQLVHALLELLTTKLRRQADKICDEFNKMAQVLYARPNGIEELMDQREFMKTVPDTVRSLEADINRALTDWELMDTFNLNLSDSDFAVRWQVYAWPQKISELMDNARQVLAADQDRFIENLGADQKEFAENVASLQMIVAGFASHNDIRKCELVAVEVRKIAKALKESQSQAQVYSNRERLCGLAVTDYDHLNRCVKDFEPFKNLWLTTDDWLKAHKVWMTESFLHLDAEAVESQVSNAGKTLAKCVKAFKDVPGCRAIAEEVLGWVEEFKPYLPLIQALRNPGMRERHWQSLSTKLGFEVRVDENFTFRKVLDLKLDKHMDVITKVGDIAGKEYGIEQALDNMEKDWQPLLLDIATYKDTGTFIMKSAEESGQLLDDHIVMTQAMSFSPYKKPFEQRITSWENKLRVTQDVLEEWALCQRNWLYLEPIFASEDMQRQLPSESKRYQKMDAMWRRSMEEAHRTPGVLAFCADVQLLETFRECNKLLDQVQKGLSAYLETKRGVFPRFYFLSDDELLEILSQTKDPTAVQPHMRKCFDNIARLTFEEDLRMSHFVSADGESVPFREQLYPEGNVEDWLLEVERIMVVSLRQTLMEALDGYYSQPRQQFVLQWPGQIAIAACQTTWTAEVEKALTSGQEGLSAYENTMQVQLSDLVALVRGPLTAIQRNILSALIVIEVHAKDVVANMASKGVQRSSDFEWIAQLRYYWEEDPRPHGKDLHVKAVNAVFDYGYEYLGNTGRLVITPLTDRCYLTLTGALSLVYGGAPAGPAGTGKTESVKDLGKAIAYQCVVFNCSDQLDYIAMGKFFKGLASAGAWACFDEFNRIDIEVLSVVAQQVATIQQAIKNREKRFVFEGVELSLRWSCAPFITMNPGYAGRTELPDNLAALFRPVAMMVPDYAMIAEIMLYSFGFDDAKALARKITTVFKLSSEQLSSQDHYDFGMRAVKTVISAAGNLKRAFATMAEDVIVLRAIREVNVPKFLADDLLLFDGIVSDLFPHTRAPPVDYGALDVAIRIACRNSCLQAIDAFVTKVVQLYETTVVRHGLMLVGPTGSGKTRCYEVLASALTTLAGQPTANGGIYAAVHPAVLNPKSITMGQLYGAFDELTHEWTDGILSTLIRQGVAATDSDKRWYVFDGPVDAIWIENMNTVLDDNKKLCLASGEIIALTPQQTMIFEVEDLTVASPATVSRCGMVYLEPSLLGLNPFVESWLESRLPALIQPHTEQLRTLFTQTLAPALETVRRHTREVVGTVDSQLTFALMKLLDCFFAPYAESDGRPVPLRRRTVLPSLIEPWFYFSVVWSIGATCDEEGRKKFSDWLMQHMADHKAALPFPKGESVYGFRLADDGNFNPDAEEEQDDDKISGDSAAAITARAAAVEAAGKSMAPSWVRWSECLPAFEVDPRAEFSSLIVPTEDTERYSYILEKLMLHNKPLLVVGGTGTAKTLTVTHKLLRGMPASFVSHFITFSARTSANQTQDMIDAKLDKRRKGVFGPPLGKQFVIFVDDLNMPAREVYGAQPPIELLRQWLDHGGWYDRKTIGAFRQLVDLTCVGAMGPPGGGRNPITKRLSRHFNFLALSELSDSCKGSIFRPIVTAFMKQLKEVAAESLAEAVVNTTIAVYNTISKELLPTPAKVHYTFNLRDLSKVFQGMLMCDPERIEGRAQVVRLWVHECRRVFRDRLINDEDRDWFNKLLHQTVTTGFEETWDKVVPQEPLLYGDYFDVNGGSLMGANGMAAAGGGGGAKPTGGDGHDGSSGGGQASSNAAGGPAAGSGNQDGRRYAELPDIAKIKVAMDEALEDYNGATAARMNLVLFQDAIEHTCRLGRIIRQPMGNALCLGVGGSGRQSLTRLATFLVDYECVQIELSKNYGVVEWREDLRRVLRRAGLENQQIVFLFSDTQIKDESFLEDLNNILNSGDVPGLYEPAELDEIFLAMKPVVQAQGDAPTKSNLYSAYCRRVRRNIHCVICMSPIGEVFRARLRQFPALVNCCTIDWYSAWPDEALRSVAVTFLSSLPELADDQPLLDGLVTSCVNLQQSVLDSSARFKSELGRTNFVTPTSYLDLLALFSGMLGRKKRALSEQRARTAMGLEKLLATAKEVADLQEELTTMQPMLREAKEETEATMVKIAADKDIAQETAAQVGKEEKEADLKAKATQEIADDAQRDLDEALPALDAAVASLKTLNKNDITEVKSMLNPPAGVRMVMEAVCIMQGVKPKKIAGDKPGSKVDDYWSASGPLLQNPQKFLDSLFNFDKDNIPEKIIAKIEPFINDEAFKPAAIEKVSKACTSICKWVRAMHKYYHVARNVEPKRQALAKAKEELQATLEQLESAKSRLREVNDRIADMEAKFDAMVTKKRQLEDKAEECSLKLQRAEKLISLLGDEKIRWKDSVERFDALISNVVGDIVLSAGTVAYLGPFTSEFRAALCETWRDDLAKLGVRHTSEADLVSTLSDPLQIRDWQICGLPKDSMSVENACIVKYSQRWPLFIDPQGQANKWIREMEAEKLVVMKLTDRDFLRSLENAVRFGSPCLLENVAEELDPALEPILLRQTFKQAGSTVIRLGDSIIPYHDDFKFYITTKLPNPVYTPEVSTKVTLVNFTLSPSGLEDQMLGLVVAEERPDLEEAKNALIIQNAKMKQELAEIEDRILKMLSESKGSPVDDEELINTLDASKVKSQEISAKVQVAEETERDIDETRSKYVPVAIRSQLLFFCTTDLAQVDPMYQYSLAWFRQVFINGLARSAQADDVTERVANINEYFTFSLFSNVCRSLFEKHKLLFAFILCARILMHDGKIDMAEWRFLINGSASHPEDLPNPAPSWLNDRAWKELRLLSRLPRFQGFAADVVNHLAAWRRMFDSAAPHREPLPEAWASKLDAFQRLLVVRCLRYDMLAPALQDFVSAHLGQKFIEPQTTNLSTVFAESSATTPLVFVLSRGTDPAADLYKFAEEMHFSRKLAAISLGQGQGPRAEAMFKAAAERGTWVFFQNCHLAPSWMPMLERLIENIDPVKVHRDFRLWLTSVPSLKFPVAVLQNSSKMTVEPPRGIKANLLEAYAAFDDGFLTRSQRSAAFKKLLFSLCLFHGVILERRKYGSLGFNIRYPYNKSDLAICTTQLQLFLDSYEEPPYKVLTYTAGEINYGGRVTDDWDRRLQMTLLEDFYRAEVVESAKHEYSSSGIYHQIEPTNYEGYLAYIRSLPINDTPEIFGLHENANITFANNETNELLAGILATGGSTAAPAAAVAAAPAASGTKAPAAADQSQADGATDSGAAAASLAGDRDSVIAASANEILQRLPAEMDLDLVQRLHPVRYDESMNTVLAQEVIRFNRLLRVVRTSLTDLLKALKGLVVMSEDLERLGTSLFTNQVPAQWAAKAYPSLKPLASWVADLLDRLKFVRGWIEQGVPVTFWLSGFFFPQAFLTGTLQNYARKHVVSIDSLSFAFEVLTRPAEDIHARPEDGCYIYGLYLEGARWDSVNMRLEESRPKELYTSMAAIWLKPQADRIAPSKGLYVCPCYKTLQRAGTLSTTGHSTNFVLSIELPSDQAQSHWIKRGVALICALDY